MFGYFDGTSDVDMFHFTPKAPDSIVGVRLTNLGDDGDLVLYGPRRTEGSQAGSRRVGAQPQPIADLPQNPGAAICSSSSVARACITSARKVLNRAVELEFMTVTKRVPQESIYKLTGKPLSELQEESYCLVARFEELLTAWGIPMAAPNGQPGRVHQRFLKYQM